MAILRGKIEKYYILVQEHVDAGRNGDAAVNVRHILELIVDEYIRIFEPSYVFAKTIEKIDILYEKKRIDNLSVNTLHQLRKLANKGAHGEGDAISDEEIAKIIDPLRMEIDRFYDISEKKEKENGKFEIILDDDVKREYNIEWVERIFNSSISIRDYQNLIYILKQYKEYQSADEYIQKCQEKIKEKWEIAHSNEIRLAEYKERNRRVKGLIDISDNLFYTLDIFGTYYMYHRYDFSGYNFDDNYIKLKYNNNVKELLVCGGEIYALTQDGKVFIQSQYNISNTKFVSDKLYGEWDDIISMSLIGNDMFGITRDNRVRKSYLLYSSHEKPCFWRSAVVNEWREICKVTGTEKCIVGLRIDGTIVYEFTSLRIDEKEEEGSLSIYSSWENLEDIVVFSDYKLVGLTRDGKVFCNPYYKEMYNELSQWTDVIKIQASFTHILGLKVDGTVVSFFKDDINVRSNCADVSQWTNVIDIYIRENQSMALREDGWILSCGKDSEKYNIRICRNVFHFNEEYQREQMIWELLEKIGILQKEKEAIKERIATLSPIFHFKRKKELEQDYFQVESELSATNEKLEDLYKRAGF